MGISAFTTKQVRKLLKNMEEYQGSSQPTRRKSKDAPRAGRPAKTEVIRFTSN
jgi:hypothetical protein